MNELVKILMQKYPQIEKLIWNDESQQLKEEISLILNHETIQSKRASSIPLSDGDKIAFLLPISGG